MVRVLNGRIWPLLVLAMIGPLNDLTAGDSFPSGRDAWWALIVLVLVTIATWLAVRRPERGESGGTASISAPVTDPAERLAGDSSGVHRERKAAAERTTEVLVRQGASVARIGSWERDLRSDRVIWSEQAYRLFGISRYELAGTYQAFLALIHPEDRANADAVMRAAIGQHQDYRSEYRVTWPDGSVHWLVGSGEVTRNEHGEPLRMSGVILDVSERKMMEGALRLSEERLREGLAAAGMGAWDCDIATGRVTWSPGVEALFDIEPGGFAGTFDAFMALVPSEHRQQAQEAINQALSQGEQFSFEHPIALRSGGERWLADHGRVLRNSNGKPVAMRGVVMDITARKSVDRAMRESEQRLRTLAESDPNIVYMIDRIGTILFINRTLARSDRQSVLGSSIRDHIRPTSLAAYLAAIGQVFETGDLVEIEVESLNPEGGWSWYLSRIGPMRSGGRIIAVVVTTMDITDRKRVEEERRELQRERETLLARLQTQIERMPIVFMEFDAQFRIVSINPAAERTFGWSSAEVRGRHVLDTIIPPERRQAMEELLERIATGDRSIRGRDTGLAKDGRRVLCDWYNTPLMGADGTFIGAFNMAIDVSEQRQLEDQLRQSQKMEAVGKLAGGIAHDFNNLLTAIMGYGDLLLLRHPLGDSSHSHLAQIKKSAQRAAGLTQQLLAFSRKQVLQPKVINLNDTIREMEGLLRRLISEQIEMQFALDPGLWRVRADVGQLEQVVMNLAVNARDAMTRGGRLSLSTRNRLVRSFDVPQLAEVEVGDYVQLTVADTGEGMDDATQARIFEPFFTTKRDGKGTGLGLSVVFGVVKQSGGHVFVTSKAGKGSTFDILLPRAQEAAGEASSQSRTSVLIPAFGTETVLVVEDDEAVRGFVRDTLSSSGYTVIDVADGRKALEIAPHFPRQIHLLLTDVIMPHLGGRELAEQLVKLRPEIKVLFMSGYTDDLALTHGVSAGSAALIEKPFTARDLLIRVRQILGG